MYQIEQQIERHVTALQQHAVMQSRNAAAADALVQECLLHALVKADRYEPGTNLRAWLFTILHNLSLRDMSNLTSAGQLVRGRQPYWVEPENVTMVHISDRKGALRRAINRADLATFVHRNPSLR